MKKESKLSPKQKIDSLNYEHNLGEYELYSMSIKKGEKILKLKEKADDSSIAYAISKDDTISTILSFELFSSVLDDMKKLNQEIFELKLEKTIWKYLPKDFNDVYSVVTQEIVDIHSIDDIEFAMQELKKNHPNLFIDMEDMNI